MSAFTSRYTIFIEWMINNHNANIVVANHSKSNLLTTYSFSKYYPTLNIGCYFYQHRLVNISRGTEIPT